MQTFPNEISLIDKTTGTGTGADLCNLFQKEKQYLLKATYVIEKALHARVRHSKTCQNLVLSCTALNIIITSRPSFDPEVDRR